jgi:hypothetical protein
MRRHGHPKLTVCGYCRHKLICAFHNTTKGCNFGIHCKNLHWIVGTKCSRCDRTPGVAQGNKRICLKCHKFITTEDGKYFVPKKKCKFYATPKGCNKGAACQHEHTESCDGCNRVYDDKSSTVTTTTTPSTTTITPAREPEIPESKNPFDNLFNETNYLFGCIECTQENAESFLPLPVYLCKEFNRQEGCKIFAEQKVQFCRFGIHKKIGYSCPKCRR